MNRYDSYKDSGVEWIGEIPSHWNKIKIKNTVDPKRKITYGIVQPGKEDPNGILMIRGKDYSNGWVDISEVFRVSPEIELPYSRSRVISGDIVYTIVGGVGNIEIVPREYEGSNLTQTTGRISVKNGINSKWVYHSLQSELNPVQIKLSQVGSVIPGISLDTLKNFIILLPPLSEQHQIVEYLDNKTSSIDSQIQSKGKKITLLKEKRTSLINQVVTKGLNPNVEMKDSGVEWIGEIPREWFCVGTNKVFFDIGSGTTPSTDNQDYYDDGTHHWITTTDLNEGLMDDTITKLTDRSITDYPNLTLYPSGSIYISMYGGRIGKIGLSSFNSYCNQSVCVLPNNNSVECKYYYYWFLGFQEQVKMLGRGGGQPNINKEMIKSFPVLKIPLHEQLEIVSYLDKETRLIDETISSEQKKIELLKEYKQSLISEVVTGKRKVVD